MTMLDDIRRDLVAGTPGPWELNNGTLARPLEVAGCLLAHFSKDPTAPPHREANARRIARVPQMEAALLAAEELLRRAEEARAVLKAIGADTGALDEAITTLRAAMEDMP